MIYFLFILCLCTSNVFAECRPKFLFNYKNEEISNIVNKIAALKNINILFDPKEKISAKLNFNSKIEYDINEAWDIIQHVLNIAGFSVVKKKDIYELLPNSGILKEPLEIFINANPDTLPKSKQKIRYLYLFENLSINQTGQTAKNLEQILKDMLPNDTSNYILDSGTNSLLISGNSIEIIGVLKIILELDKTGFREAIEVIPILHADPNHISKIITQLVTPPQEQHFGYFPKTPKKNLYFSENTKVVAIDQNNSIAILGPVESIKKIKNFIVKYLDKPLNSIKSVIHVRPLEYLDSNDLAPVLQNVVKGKAKEGQAESTDELANAIILTEQQINTDALKPTESGDPSANSGKPVTFGEDPSQIETEKGKPQLASGSNALIIAARQNDWIELKNIINELDTPQPQIVVDVMIAELDISFTKELGSQTRNINNTNLPRTLNFQTANLTAPILNYNQDGTINSQKGLAANLLAPALNSETVTNVATNSAPGSFMASFQDLNGAAYFTRLLDRKNTNNILFHGYSFIKNNNRGIISSTLIQFFPGAASSQQAGAYRIQKDAVTATIGLDIVPTISKAQTIDMNLNIKVEVFDSLVPGQVNSRDLSLKATVGDNEVLVIGGLMRYENLITDFETPLLSKIPIIGSLFYKKRDYTLSKKPIYMFILPKILRPKLRGGYNNYTKDKIDLLKYELSKNEEALLGKNFSQLKDPITKFFLPTGYKEFNEQLDNFTGPQEIHKKEPELNGKINKIKDNLKNFESRLT